MYCNEIIHNDLINDGELLCPFCDEQLKTLQNTVDPCCSKQEMVNINGMNACVNCGLVNGYDYVQEYFNFYEKYV